jgi:hypothetical protein
MRRGAVSLVREMVNTDSLQIRSRQASLNVCSMRTKRTHTVVLATLGALLAVSVAYGQDSTFDLPLETEEHGIAIHLDNDLFSGVGRDSDYSWGATATFASAERIAALDRVRSRLASWLPSGVQDPARGSSAAQLGILAMTPEDLSASDAQHEDRPYASLVFLTAAELRVFEGVGRARFSGLTVGLLGTGAAELAQRAVHEVLGGDVPNGWAHQISEGGEPTARFVYAEQWLLADGHAEDAGGREIKLTVGGSAGYLTEGSAAVSMRWGRIRTPWWSFNPELGDYGAAPIAPITGFGIDAPPEIYGFVGARVKARAYNALLQGQFRHSDVRVSGDDIAHLQAEAWAGITSNWSDWRLTYSVHVASRELTPEPAARTLVWASLSVERAF